MSEKNFESIEAAYEAGVQAGIALMEERRKSETRIVVARCTRTPEKTQPIIPSDVDAANMAVRK
jgi:hypothetical protein